jgi:signal recognition particle subunit SRP72
MRRAAPDPAVTPTPNQGAKRSDISKKIKKRQKRKIRWPKGFDPKNPPKSLPDPERWMPKYERKKFAKLAKKKGYMTRTQGTTVNIDASAKKGGMKQGPSTANMKASTSKSSKRSKKRRKR